MSPHAPASATEGRRSSAPAPRWPMRVRAATSAAAAGRPWRRSGATCSHHAHAPTRTHRRVRCNGGIWRPASAHRPPPRGRLRSPPPPGHRRRRRPAACCRAC
eukprot:2666916-Prymnesium_polylepis.1